MTREVAVSLIYISNRYGGLDILKANILRQQFFDYEIVFVDGLYNERKDEVAEYFKHHKMIHLPEPEMGEGYVHKLARCWNVAFKACSGKLLISLQDYIYIPPDAFNKFLYLYSTFNPNALYSGVGHQYAKPGVDKIKNPNGLISVFEKEYTKKPENLIWTDPRVRGTDLRMGEPIEWEANWCAIPRSIIYELGGMDEEYDKHGFGYDNTNIAERAKMLGYPTFIDQSNECFGFRHDDWWPNKLKNSQTYADKYHFEIINKMKNELVSPILKYLP